MVMFAAMLWGSDVIFRPLALHSGTTALSLVLAEHVLLGLLFFPILVVTAPNWRKLKARDWGCLLILAGGGSALATWLFSSAMLYANPLMAVLIQKTQPVFTLILATLLGERRRPLFWLFLVCALFSTVLLVFGHRLLTAETWSDLLRGGVQPLYALYALGAAAIWGTCTVIGRKLSGVLAVGAITGWRFVLAIPFLLATAILSAPGHHVTLSGLMVSPAAVSILVVIVLVPDVLGMCLYYYGLRATPASIATVAELAMPITAIVVTWAMHRQTLGIEQWVGMALLMASVRAMEMSGVVIVQPVRQRSMPLTN